MELMITKSVKVKMTEEEKNILKKASKLLEKLGYDLDRGSLDTYDDEDVWQAQEVIDYVISRAVD